MNGGSYNGNGNDLPTSPTPASWRITSTACPNTYHVNIYALSMQNEPDANVTSTRRASGPASNFMISRPTFIMRWQRKGWVQQKSLSPESQNWASRTSLFTPTLTDSNAADVVSIVADHNYVQNNLVGDTTTPLPLSTPGKALWETEVSQLGGTYDGSVTNGIYWAGRIHAFLTAAQANAWHYWWLIDLNNGNEGLTDTMGFPPNVCMPSANSAASCAPAISASTPTTEATHKSALTKIPNRRISPSSPSIPILRTSRRFSASRIFPAQLPSRPG